MLGVPSSPLSFMGFDYFVLFFVGNACFGVKFKVEVDILNWLVCFDRGGWILPGVGFISFNHERK